jgi:hypothetical protein
VLVKCHSYARYIVKLLQNLRLQEKPLREPASSWGHPLRTRLCGDMVLCLGEFIITCDRSMGGIYPSMGLPVPSCQLQLQAKLAAQSLAADQTIGVARRFLVRQRPLMTRSFVMRRTLAFAIPTLCDATASTLLNVGLFYTYVPLLSCGHCERVMNSLANL